jgi:hypothetical protein
MLLRIVTILNSEQRIIIQVPKNFVFIFQTITFAA